MTELAGLGTTHALYARTCTVRSASPSPASRCESPASTMASHDPPGEPGELMVRGPIVMLGYFGNDAATAETIEPDGWLHTGDVAVADEPVASSSSTAART